MKKIILSRLSLSIVLLILISGCTATSEVKKDSAGSDIAVITGIQVEDNKLIIASNKHFTYTVYSTADPYKTIIEIPDMSAGEFTNKIISNKSGITEIIPQQINSPTQVLKIEVVLQNPSGLVPVYSNKMLTLTVKEEEPVAKAEEAVVISEVKETADMPPPPPPIEEKSPDASKPDGSIPSFQKATEITGVELKKSADALRILITGNGSMMPNVFPLDDRIVVDIPDVTINADIPKTMMSPLKGIRAGKHKQKVRLVFDLKEKTNFDVAAIGNYIEISLQKSKAVLAQQPVLAQPVAEAVKTQASSEVYKFKGKNISIDMQDADLRSILERLFAPLSGKNIVVHPAVIGKKLNLKLDNVPWDQALDIILRTNSLTMVEEGNIIRIIPNTVFESESKEATTAEKARKLAELELAPLERKTYHLEYAFAEDVKRNLLGQKVIRTTNKETGDAITEIVYDEKRSVVSSRGQVTADRTSNVVVVEDIPTKIAIVDDFIKEVDQPIRQVMIEAKIIEVNSNYSKDLGIQWGANFAKPKAGESITIGGTGQVGAAPSGNNFLINMPAAVAAGAPGGAIGFGYISKAANFALDVQLSAMESLQKGKVISSPKIMTMNNQQAKITTGSTIYLQSTASGGNVASFTAVDATLSLTVTPRIAPGGGVEMVIDITKDAPGAVIAGNVSVSKNTAKTTVLVNDSDTVVIGGIMTTSETNVNDAVPGLSKIPLLGRLFKKDNKTEEKREVLIFITPRIVEYSSLNIKIEK